MEIIDQNLYTLCIKEKKKECSGRDVHYKYSNDNGWTIVGNICLN